MKAWNGAGESAYSAARTLYATLGAPSDLQGSTVSAGEIDLSWTASPDAPGGIDGYHIYREGAQIGMTDNVTTAYADTTAATCTTYHYTVRAYQGATKSTDSNPLTVNSYCNSIFSDGFESGDLSGWSSSVTDGGDLSVSPTAALVDGEGMQAVVNDNNPIYVIDDTPNAEGHYRAFFYFNPNSIGMTNGDNFTLFAGIQGSSTQVLQVQLRNRTGAYQLRTATLTDTAGNSLSSYVTIGNGIHTVELEWDASTGAGMNNGSTRLWVDDLLKVSQTGLDNDTRRIDRAELGAVTGIDAGTRGTLYFDGFVSRRFSHIGLDGVSPVAPTLNTPADNAMVSASDINLSWNASLGASEYFVEFTDGGAINVNSGWISGTSWSPGTQSQGTYTWQVKARNGAGASAYSAPRTLNATLGAPSDLQGSTVSAGEIGLSWGASPDAPGGIDGYHIYREGAQIGMTDNATTAYADVTAATCTTYHYTVRAYQGATESTDSDALTVNSYCDPIFSDGFESGDLSGWSSSVTDGGDLSVSPTGALVDSEGMQAVINDNNPIYVIDDTPDAEGHYRAFFYFNPNSIGMANGDNFTLFAGIQGSSTRVLQVQLRYRTGAYQLRTATLTDTAGNSLSSYVTISNAAHTVEVEWDAATALNANDGSTSLWVDGTLQATVSGLDNDTRRIDRAELGAVTGIDAGTRGTLYFDTFDSRRFSYIEPAFVGRSLLPIQPSTEMPTEVPTDKPTPETTENVTETPIPEATGIVTETSTPTEVGTETPTLEATETLTPEPSETGTETPTPELTETVAPPTQLPTALPFPTVALPTDIPTPFPTVALPTLTPLTLPVYESMDDGAPDWSSLSGWTLTSQTAFGGQGLGWQVTAENQADVLRWNRSLDLSSVLPGQMVQLSFQSLLSSAESTALVQVSGDSTNWTTLGVAAPIGQWTQMTYDLSAFVGQMIQIQFVWQGVVLDGQKPDSWWLDDVRVAAVTPMLGETPTPTSISTPEPIATPTSVSAPSPTEQATETPTSLPTESATPELRNGI